MARFSYTIKNCWIQTLYGVCFSVLLCSIAQAEYIASTNQRSDQHYRFGVLPLQSPIKLATIFMPFVDHLEQVLGKQVQFVTAADIDTFMERVSRREYDFIYLNPLPHLAPLHIDYKIIAELDGEAFTGVIVVRKGSGLERQIPKELSKDLRLGLPDLQSYVSSIMTKMYLEQLGIQQAGRFKTRYFSSHDSALLSLHYGLVDMVGTWQISLQSMPMSVRNKLTVIGESLVQPKMTIAVRNDLPETDILKLKKLLAGLSKSEQGYRSLINPVITIENLGLLPELSSVNGKTAIGRPE